jgi:hypothetical protein
MRCVFVCVQLVLGVPAELRMPDGSIPRRLEAATGVGSGADVVVRFAVDAQLLLFGKGLGPAWG